VRKIARLAAETKPRLAASRHIFAPAPWTPLARLPSRLTDLPLDARASLGRALDARLVRLVRDDDGAALVLPRGRL
jgi:hypothetical protein